jgi:hypothetical protein
MLFYRVVPEAFRLVYTNSGMEIRQVLLLQALQCFLNVIPFVHGRQSHMNRCRFFFAWGKGKGLREKFLPEKRFTCAEKLPITDCTRTI